MVVIAQSQGEPDQPADLWRVRGERLATATFVLRSLWKMRWRRRPSVTWNGPFADRSSMNTRPRAMQSLIKGKGHHGGEKARLQDTVVSRAENDWGFPCRQPASSVGPRRTPDRHSRAARLCDGHAAPLAARLAANIFQGLRDRGRQSPCPAPALRPPP